MGPESKENTAFSNWCKALATTYLDLFIRLAIVYFVLYIIIDMITNGIVIREGQGFLGIISMIFIWLGLFLFARQAPKFILDVLGVKSLGSNIGLGAILGGGAMLAGGFASGWGSARQSGGGFAQRFFGGLRGAGMGFAQGALNGMRDANEAVAQGKDLPLHNIYAQNRDLMAQMRTGDKDAKGGALGYLQDRLNYQNRELRANSLGIGKNTLAAATYEDEVAGDKYRKAQAATASAASKVSSMKGVNGGMMDFDEWSTKTGSTDNTQYAAYQNDYNNAVKEWQQLQAYEEKARVKTIITGANKKAIDESRGSLGVSPRAADVWNDSYRSQTEIEYWNEELHNQDGSLQYNDDGSVRTGITRIAVDSSGEPLAEFERDANGNYVYDQYGHRVIRDTKVNNYGEIVAAGRETGEDARQKFGYNRSTKAFDGTIDDSTFGASNRGSSGSGSGGTP